MSRGIKDLRELINVSRLSCREEDEEFELQSSDEEEFRILQKRVATPAPPSFVKKNKKPSRKVTENKDEPTTELKLNRISPLPPLSAGSRDSSRNSSASSSSSRNSFGKTSLNETQNEVYGATKRFRTNRTDFDSILEFMEGSTVSDWLVRANDAVEFLSSWGNTGDNMISFLNFWLTEILPAQWKELLRMEVGFVIDELSYSFAGGRENKNVRSHDLVEFLTSVLWEYPKELCGNKMCLVNFLLRICSDKNTEYKKLLSDVRCSTKNRQYAQWILALRSFALTSICNAVIRFYISISGKEGTTAQSQDFQALVVSCTFQAVKEGYREVVECLVECYSKELFHAKDQGGKSLLFCAILNGYSDIVQALIKQGHDVNQAAVSGNTPLQAAINLGNVNMVKTLINAGADVNYFNIECDGATPLHLAIMQGNEQVVAMLLASGADASARMGVPATVTPVSLATDLGLDDIVELFAKLTV